MKTNLRQLVFLMLVTLGLAVRSTAAEAAPGLLGTGYFAANYAWHDFSGTSVDAEGFAFEVNWPVRSNLDFTLTYDRWETDEFFGVRGRQQTWLAGMRLYGGEAKTQYYLAVDMGETKAEVSSFLSDKVLTYRIGAGAEFNLSRSITLTPFVHGEFYGSGGDSGTLAYGLKAHAWLGRHWAFNAAIHRNDDGDMSYRLGLGVRF